MPVRLLLQSATGDDGFEIDCTSPEWEFEPECDTASDEAASTFGALLAIVYMIFLFAYSYRKQKEMLLSIFLETIGLGAAIAFIFVEAVNVLNTHAGRLLIAGTFFTLGMHHAHLYQTWRVEVDRDERRALLEQQAKERGEAPPEQCCTMFVGHTKWEHRKKYWGTIFVKAFIGDLLTMIGMVLQLRRPGQETSGFAVVAIFFEAITMIGMIVTLHKARKRAPGPGWLGWQQGLMLIPINESLVCSLARYCCCCCSAPKPVPGFPSVDDLNDMRSRKAIDEITYEHWVAHAMDLAQQAAKDAGSKDEADQRVKVEAPAPAEAETAHRAEAGNAA
ncbi:unnamed protein product [Pedinophyceae sp. YPF-701]|nr:unnamed protein product [Pedinophyceae sp. YPF-701]